MKLLLFLFSIFLFTQVSVSQINSNPGYIVAGGIGLTSHFFIDHHSSPLRYRGIALYSMLQLLRNTGHGQHRIALGYDAGTFRSSVSTSDRLYEKFFRIQFQGGYVHTILYFSGERVRLSGGFFFDNTFVHRDHYYFQNRNELFLEYIASFHPVVEVNYYFSNRISVHSRSSASTIAYIYHSPYAVRGPMQHTFELFGSFNRVDTQLSYQQLLNERTHIEIIYSFTYYRHSNPQPIRVARDQFMVLFAYRI